MSMGMIAEFHLPLFYQDKDQCHACLKQFELLSKVLHYTGHFLIHGWLGPSWHIS